MLSLLKLRILENFESQRRFAKKLGLREPHVSEVVRGRRIIPVKEQERWAETLGVKRQDVFPEIRDTRF